MAGSYLNAIQTKYLATNCVICGLPLVDAISCELGVGPDCRGGNDAGIASWKQDEANKLTYQAAIAAQIGHIEKVNAIAEEIERLGLPVLAGKLRGRFDMTTQRKVKCKIEITPSANPEVLFVKTPFRNQIRKEFLTAWGEIPGQRWSGPDNARCVPVAQKAKLWALLKRFFPGSYGKGPDGFFRIPTYKQQEATGKPVRTAVA